MKQVPCIFKTSHIHNAVLLRIHILLFYLYIHAIIRGEICCAQCAHVMHVRYGSTQTKLNLNYENSLALGQMKWRIK